MRFIKGLFLHQRLFYGLAVLALLYLLSYWFHGLFGITNILLLVFLLLVFIDALVLFRGSGKIKATRALPEKFSNSDVNELKVTLENKYPFSVSLDIIDEIPVQFQKRDFSKHIEIPARESSSFIYTLRPTERGEYVFGHLNLYASTKLKLVRRRYRFEKDQMVKVYPSFIQMKKYAFLALDNRLTLHGMKKIRRIGHTMEFEQIKDYVPGDDARTINWKATAKRGSLMVNQFQDEKSQPVYALIDASRVMKMPFKGLTLLDYAINSTLAFSNIALKKKDKVGMLTFAEEVKNHLPASSKKTHLQTILEVLYNINTKFLDSDYGGLYNQVKRKITQRSLLLLYTNFEHITALERQLPYLKALSRKHILVVIFFQNTELDQLITKPATSLPDVYHKTIAQKADYDKKVMVARLEQYGIQTILTKPDDLTVNTINKYLEIKARGIL
ncbi:cell division protein DivIC (FtsB), stabilizes FtsL against RasP cleavage [Dokdonia donghaensis DSW-1]|uniref:Cell division protein DivIC (FtsB), stabilizes FtsL against RasP cleavage n=1 Tax=Dokdonia donghaensis DSW-1 TaxID=1300343 RepID=A0A0A2GZJ3_9FLAO|nr:cell division protein DivIC (FtsB), stabilizes FtsL against RasP cleavage [Dokdonia donghaensis DSW-1]